MTSLEAAIRSVRDVLSDSRSHGIPCPCCQQLVKPYRRSLNHLNIRVLVLMYRTAGSAPVHIPTLMSDHLPDFAHQGGQVTLSHHWGLIQECPELRDDGGRAGWWVLDGDVEKFLHNAVEIRKYAVLFNQERLRFEGGWVTAQQCLGKKFDLRRLMNGTS